MSLTFWSAENAKKKARDKALEQNNKFLDDVVVEPTSPADSGEVGTLPQEPAEEVEVKEIEEVKPKKKRK